MATPRVAIPRVSPPQNFDLGSADASEKWKIFKQRWANYCVIADLNVAPNDTKMKPTFLHLLGDEALKAYNSFNLADDATVDDIVNKFDTFIIGEKNVAFERYKFNKRSQKEGETFDIFHSDLLCLVKTCEFCNNCRDSLIRDRIVIGTNDAQLQKELLKMRNLTLKQCIDMCRAYENATKHNNQMMPELVNKIQREQKKKYPTNEAKCRYCGTKHTFKKEKCPAYGKECSKCKKMNHFAIACKTINTSYNKPKKVHNINEEYEREEDYSEEDSSEELINNIKTTKNNKQIKCQMLIKKRPVIFQIDSGSSVNIIPEKYVDGSINTTTTMLKTWNNENYTPLGESRVSMKNPKNGKRYGVNFIVCHNDFTPILGLRASTQMNLIEIQEANFERVNAISEEYNEIFNEEIGQFKGEVSLKTKEEIRPIIMPDRKTPIALRQPLKTELDRLTRLKVIKPISEPTRWVSQAVIVPKKDNKIRLCIDPRELNKALIRERYTLPTIDDTLHELQKSRIFSKADLVSGYWHVLLDEEASKMTTFQTCFGRFRWMRLPFGLSVSAEIFQRRLTEIFSDLPGIICVADDIIIHGINEKEHDERMEKFLTRCKEEGVRLNKHKMDYKMSSITFMGHRVTADGLQIDENKIKAINNMPAPTNISSLRSFLGLVNFLSKFIPYAADVLHPLNNLLRKDVTWTWSENQEQSFNTIKQLICKASTLSYYNPNKELTLENDASEYGLGSVLTQEGRPLAFASRSLSDTERRYAQIEKEMLAIVYGLEKFHHYVYGRHINVHTDHKPLVSISQKPISKAPKRLQSLILRTQMYTFDLSYKQGKSIPVADALSRAPVDKSDNVNLISNACITSAKEEKLEEIRRETEKDTALKDLKHIITNGWPEEKLHLPTTVTPYFSYRDELSVEDGIIYRGERIVIPSTLRRRMKEKIHAGHSGINSCLRRARTYVYWPGMSTDIRQHVENCNTCASLPIKQQQEPLIQHETPENPWEKVGTDIFTINSRNYLVTVDYYSQFFEIDYLSDTTSETIIQKLKSNFARHGIPTTLISDNGPQYTSKDFVKFCQKWDIQHRTISPGNSKANGLAEATVKIAKKMMKKCSLNKEDPYLALLNIRNTPQEGTEYSPTQRIMGRRTKTLIPTHNKLLKPNFTTDYKLHKDIQKTRVAERHINNKELKPLNISDTVRIQPIQNPQDIWKKATVSKQLNPRSYIVTTEDGRELRRNRVHLRLQKESSSPRKQPRNTKETPTKPSQKEPTAPLKNCSETNGEDPPLQTHTEHEETNTAPKEDSSTTAPVITTRSGRIVKPPQKYE